MLPHRLWVTSVLAFCVAGCAFTSPYVGQGPHLQIRRGNPVPPIDALGNLLALPTKLVLWSWKFSNHAISQETENALVKFLDARTLPAFEETVYRLNEYAPLDDLRALRRNHHVAWPYRLLLGLPLTLITDVLLPGRIFPWGDYFNPYTNVTHLYSDDAAIALHEAGHAYDFADFPAKGTYSAIRLIPFVDLYQEWRATDEAISYLVEAGDRNAELHAYRMLWPAYSTYIGGYAPFPFGSIAGALVGHMFGYVKVKTTRAYYKRMDAALHPDTTQPLLSTHPSTD